jgi:hypothetical protein
MAPPQEDEWEKDQDDRGPPPWVSEIDADITISEVPDIVLSIVAPSVSTTAMEDPMTLDVTDGPWGPENNARPTASPIPQPTVEPDPWQSDRPGPPYGLPRSTTKSFQTSISATTAYADHWVSSSLGTTSSLKSATDDVQSLSPTNSYGGRPSNWNFSHKHVNKAPIYAAAAIIPIVLLAIIGGVTLLCRRKRKRRKAVALAAAANSAQEMKMQSSVQPYLAPPPPSATPLLPAISISQQYNNPPQYLPPTSTSSAVHPIILGPIVSSASNGAYLTGMDTSDMVSVTSNTLRPGDPFTDNGSLAEQPPPPYRPHSVAPPSFMTNSSHSSRSGSLREGGGEGEMGSRTHLIGRSPFDDPDEEDRVSDLSGPTLGSDGHGDDMSVVSDLSYQRDGFGGNLSS